MSNFTLNKKTKEERASKNYHLSLKNIFCKAGMKKSVGKYQEERNYFRKKIKAANIILKFLKKIKMAVEKIISVRKLPFRPFLNYKTRIFRHSIPKQSSL